jgi:hypothetical protein
MATDNEPSERDSEANQQPEERVRRDDEGNQTACDEE